MAGWQRVYGKRNPLLWLALVLGSCGSEVAESPAEAHSQPQSVGPCADRFDWGRGGEWMFPGTDCLACHRAGGSARTLFSVAGTVFRDAACPEGVAGVVVEISDTGGKRIDLTSNEVGNFFSDQPLTPPLRIVVHDDASERRMLLMAPHGSCNQSSCHAQAGHGFVALGR